MSELFSDCWMKKFQQEWNRDRELTSALADIQFNTTIGYGFPDESKPRVAITIREGRIIYAGPYTGETLNWDLRAREKHWQQWLQQEIGNASVGLAYSTGKLKFLVGDFRQLLKNPDLHRPFVRSFSVMGRAAA